MPPDSPYGVEDYANAAGRAVSALGSLRSKKALVIGAGDLGTAAAFGLAGAGAAVAIASRSSQRVSYVATALATFPVTTTGLTVDVTKPNEVSSVLEAAAAQLGGLDTVVLAFGTNRRMPAVEVSDELWNNIIATNLNSVFTCCREAYPHLEASRNGSLIVVASVAGHAARSWPPTAPYGASKAGAVHLVRYLAAEWGRSGVRVNAISPGYIRTKLTGSLVDDEEVLDRMLSLTPMARLGSIEEFVGPLLFLASDASGFITGHSLIVDGGRAVV